MGVRSFLPAGVRSSVSFGDRNIDDSLDKSSLWRLDRGVSFSDLGNGVSRGDGNVLMLAGVEGSWQESDA